MVFSLTGMAFSLEISLFVTKNSLLVSCWQRNMFSFNREACFLVFFFSTILQFRPIVSGSISTISNFELSPWCLGLPVQYPTLSSPHGVWVYQYNFQLAVQPMVSGPASTISYFDLSPWCLANQYNIIPWVLPMVSGVYQYNILLWAFPMVSG